MHIYIHIYIYIYMYIHTHIVHICVYCMCGSLSLSLHIYMYTHIHIYIYTHSYIVPKRRVRRLQSVLVDQSVVVSLHCICWELSKWRIPVMQIPLIVKRSPALLEGMCVLCSHVVLTCSPCGGRMAWMSSTHSCVHVGCYNIWPFML